MQIDTTRITQSVSVSLACQTYGIPINRQGFSHCPFHSGDNTPSFKIYPNDRGFYCFGCGAGGDVIKFVRQLFNLDFMGAVKKLNADFSLGLDEKPSYAEYRKAQKMQAEREQAKKRKAELLEELKRLSVMHRKANQLINNYHGGEPDQATAVAIHNIEFIRYKIEVMENELTNLNC